MRRAFLLWCISGVLVAGAAYEVALMLWGSYSGLEPGQSAAGENVVAAVAGFAMIAGLVLVALGRARAPNQAAVTVFAVAAAAFVTARFFTYDPYYFPTLRRYSDGGILPLWWVLVVSGLAVLAGLATRFWLRLGSILTFPAVLLAMFNLVWMGTGH